MDMSLLKRIETWHQRICNPQALVNFVLIFAFVVVQGILHKLNLLDYLLCFRLHLILLSSHDADLIVEGL